MAENLWIANWLYVTGPGNSILVGNAVIELPTIIPMDSAPAKMVARNGTFASVIDKVLFDFSNPYYDPSEGLQVGGFPVNGCAVVTLSGSTATTIDLTDLAATVSGVISAGASTFITINAVVFNNLGNSDVLVSPGATDPARVPPLGGTNPTLTVPLGGCVPLFSPVGYAVDSTHKNITITPATNAGGRLAIAIAGNNWPYY